MFGPHGGAVVSTCLTRDPWLRSARRLPTRVLSRFEAHELFESRGSPTGRPVPGCRGGLPSAGTAEGCSVMADTATVLAIQARQHACNSLTMRRVRWADSAALGDYIRPCLFGTLWYAVPMTFDATPNGPICAARGPGRYTGRSAGQVRGRRGPRGDRGVDRCDHHQHWAAGPSGAGPRCLPGSRP